MRHPPKSLKSGIRLPAGAGEDRRLAETVLSEIHRRRSEDPLLGFKLFQTQADFADSVLMAKHEENFYLGANRAGKSDVGSYIGATLARFGYPENSPLAPRHVGGAGSSITVRDRATSGWVSALDFGTSRDTIQPKYFDNGFVPPGATHKPFIPEHEIEEWRQNDQVLRLKNGSIVGFKSADSGRSKYQGAEKDWVQLDEEHPENIYNEIVIRVGAKRLNVFTTATLLPPEGTMIGGITWLFPRVIDPWKKGEMPNVGIFRASIYDNPHIPEGELRRLEARFPLGSVQGRIRLGGELIAGAAGARIYASFDRDLNTAKEHPELSPRRPLVWTMDFNIEPMVSLVGQQDGEFFRVYREIVLEEGSIDLMVGEFRRLFPRHWAEVHVHGDASGNARSHQTRRSTYQLLQNLMLDYPAPVRLYVPESNPPVDTRIQAVNRACRDERGHRLLQVHQSCEELIADLEQVVSDGRNGIKKVSNKKDSYFRRTHTCLTGDTRVTMADGREKLIQLVRVGEELTTGIVTAAGPTHIPDVLIEVELETGRIIRCTPEHRFLAHRGIVFADDLKEDDLLLTRESREYHVATLLTELEDGLLGLRAAIRFVTTEPLRELWCGPRVPGSVTRIANKSLVRNVWGSTYDLTVEGSHCYEAEGVLVSNSDALGYWLAWSAPVVSLGRSTSGRGMVSLRRPGYGA